MLIEEFFTIQTINKAESASGKFVVKVELNETHSIYDGHFPGNPVLPGVCQVQMVREILEELENRKLSLKSAKNIKHVGIIQPQVSKYLDFTMQNKYNEDNTISVSCTITDGERTFLKFKGLFV